MLLFVGIVVCVPVPPRRLLVVRLRVLTVLALRRAAPVQTTLELDLDWRTATLKVQLDAELAAVGVPLTLHLSDLQARRHNRKTAV